MRGAPPSDADVVYVSEAQAHPDVYHTSESCNHLPASYWETSRGVAASDGLRECAHCIGCRYDVLEL